MTWTIGRRMAALLLLAPLVAGCEVDPFQRQGTWQPSGSNQANLRAMVEEPAHLRRGIGAETAQGAIAGAAIGRLRADERHPLPTTGSTPVGAERR